MKKVFHLCLLTASITAVAIVLVVGADSARSTDASQDSAATAASDTPAAYATLTGTHPSNDGRPGDRRSPAVAPGHFHSGPSQGAENGRTPESVAVADSSALISSGSSIDGLRNSGATPPDTQVAVGPTELIEMVNNSARVWSKGGALLSTSDLGTLFKIPPLNQGSDPRILYDTQSGRFFATYISFSVFTFFGNTETVQIAWSGNSAPVSNSDWTVCQYNDTGHLHDNPALGVGDDKVAIGTDVFNWPQASETDPPLGTDTIVVDKAAMLTAGTCPVGIYGPTNAGIIRPAQSLTPTSTLYMASLPESGGTTATMWDITGTPAAHNLVRTRTDMAMAGTTLPPPATQPGTPNLIATNDTRALEAVWKSGVLDVSANTGCVPAGDTSTRSCVHLIQISTSAPAVSRELTIGGAPGAHLYYPAIRPDAADNLVVAYTMSSASVYPSAGAATLDPSWSTTASLVFKAGAGPYSGIDSSPYRWGDYSGAAVDPSDANSVWVAAEYSASGATGDWGTYITKIQAGPRVTVTPTGTPTSTGTSGPTNTPTITPTPTNTATVSSTSTNTATSTVTDTPTVTSTPTITPTPIPATPQQISAGGAHTCALTTAGGIRCWGANTSGQIGDGTTTNRTAPVDVSGLTNGVVAVSAGGGHTCALTTAGGVKCWGANDFGQLGDGTNGSRSVPVDVVGLSNGVAAVSAGGYHTCALMTTCGLKCWGKNNSGQIGDGTGIDRWTPTNVSGLATGMSGVAAGGSDSQGGHTCALTAAGGVKCWGRNDFGQLGDGTTLWRLQPVDVVGLSSGILSVGAGRYHSCALTSAGGAKCWGWGIGGQLGVGSGASSSTPLDVINLGNSATALTVGGSQSCVLMTTTGVKCWGYNSSGQLGDGSIGTNRNAPVDVLAAPGGPLFTGALAVSTGGSLSIDAQTCSVTVRGIECWGLNSSGQLGDGTVTTRTTPVNVIGFQPAPTPTPTSTPTNTPAATNTSVSTATASPTPTDTAGPTATNTSTPAGTATATSTPTLTDTSTNTPVPTVTDTPTPTNTTIPTETQTATGTDTPLPTSTATAAATNTATATASFTATATLAATSTATPTYTTVATATNTPASTRTPTATVTSTATRTPTRTAAATNTAVATATATSTPTNTPVASPTPCKHKHHCGAVGPAERTQPPSDLPADDHGHGGGPGDHIGRRLQYAMLAARAIIHGYNGALYDANADGRVDLFDLIAIVTDAGDGVGTE